MDDISFASRFVNALNQSDIQYCIIDIDNTHRVVDLLVQLDDNEKLKKMMFKLNANYIGSSTKNYSFIYSLEPDQYWELPEGYMVHTGCQMCCVSLSNLSKFKLPLDKMIQESVWYSRYFCEENYWRLSEEDYLISLLTKCVFDEKGFSNRSKEKIIACNGCYSNDALKNKLRGVFFKYTDELIKRIEFKEFDSIIDSYRTFIDY